MTRISMRPVPRLLGLAGAILLISSSAALGAYFGYSVGSHQHVAIGVVFAAAALGGEILKPLAVVGALEALRGREFLRGLLCAVLALVCVAYSFTAELSLAAGGRSDAASTRQLSAETLIAARDRRTRAQRELEGLPPARSPAEVAPLIARHKATPGANGCTGAPDGPVSRRACGEVLALQAEAARHGRRTHLEGEIARADSALAGRAGAIGEADPLASALAAYLSGLGRPTEPGHLAPWLALIPVLFLELGSALSLAMMRGRPAPGGSSAQPIAPTGPVPSIPIVPAPAQMIPAPKVADDTPCPGPEDDARGPRGGRRLGTIVDVLKAKGGRLEGGQRGIARVLGLSKTRANELLHELARLGQVRLATGPSGTVVELAA